MHRNNYKKKDTMTMVRQRYHLIPFIDIDHQKFLESYCTRGTTGHTKPRLVVIILPFHDYLNAKNQTYRWVLCSDIACQRILQFGWRREITN